MLGAGPGHVPAPLGSRAGRKPKGPNIKEKWRQVLKDTTARFLAVGGKAFQVPEYSLWHSIASGFRIEEFPVPEIALLGLRLCAGMW